MIAPKWKDKITYIQNNSDNINIDYALRFIFTYGHISECHIDLVIWYDDRTSTIDYYLTFLNNQYTVNYFNCDKENYQELINKTINFLARKLYEWEN